MTLRSHPAIPALLAGSAVIVGWWNYGWRGLLLGLTLVVFWLLLQFSRTARVLRLAGQHPVGQVDSIVMVQSRLAHGMHMSEVLMLTGSLGRQVGNRDDWQWTDSYGNDLVVSFRRGVVVRWAVAHAEAPADAKPCPPSATP
ncbi:MAG: hypothetical protein AB3X44_18600 [Leptothrix sp. (in: b-proteobacteria)]